MNTPILLTLLASLSAQGQQPTPGQAAKAPQQQITIQLVKAPAGAKIYAERIGYETIRLKDNGAAVLEGTFDADPMRSLQLRIDQRDAQGTRELWDGLALLTDQAHERIAFSYEIGGAGARAVRIPACPAPTPATDQEPSKPYIVAMGWSGLALVYIGFLAVVAALRWRRSEPT